MRLGKNFGPGTIYEQLGRFAKMIVVPGVTVGNLVYASSRDLYSKDTFVLSTRLIQNGTELQFWQTGVGKTGGSFTTAQTLSQTNFLGDKGQMPANIVYIMTHLGFSVESVSSAAGGADPSTAATSYFVNPVTSADALHAIIETFTVRLNIGRGVERVIGKLVDFPQCSAGWGIWADNAGSGTGAPDVNQATNATNGAADGLVELPVPIVFPPLIDVSLKAVVERGATIAAAHIEANARFLVTAHGHGIEMTMPVA